MVLIINAENRRMFELELLAMHRQRKALFVDECRWNVPVVGDLEVDRYDHDATTYLVAKPAPDSREVLASVRLLPTVTAHLMGDLFRHACSMEVPRGPQIWEASRLCIGSGISRRLRLALLWEMIGAVMETALLFGVRQVTFVTNSALLPLTLGCGWRADVLGPTLPDGDDEITAVAAHVTPGALRNLRRRFGIGAPVTRFAVPVSSRAA